MASRILRARADCISRGEHQLDEQIGAVVPSRRRRVRRVRNGAYIDNLTATASSFLAVEDDLRGEEVMAYVVPGDGVPRKEVSPSVLSAFCVERLARFKLPRYWRYRGDLPRTPSERIRKEALREEHDDPTAGAWDRVEERWR